jgi:hypothetical protein
MSSWANLGLSALSNVTQSVQALSSYAQVVLHEAREEVCCATFRVSRINLIRIQVESELLGEGVSPTLLDATSDSVSDPPAVQTSTVFSSRAQLISPPRLKHRSESESHVASESLRIVADKNGFECGDARDEILQLQVLLRPSLDICE